MSDGPKYEYKIVVVTQDRDSKDPTKYLPMSCGEAVEYINQLGLEGWMVRSHTFNNSKHPVTITYLMVRKL